MNPKQPQAQRTAQDACLLCQQCPASKKNSHIFPKFWVKSMLGTGHGQRLGFQISSSPRSLQNLGQKVQDSPKQDFLFCPGCEKRFMGVENYVANAFYHRFRDPNASNDFPVVAKPSAGISHMTVVSLNSIMFKLFIYSLVWRASVATHPVFGNFKLPASEEEGLRQILDSFLREEESDTVAVCQENAYKFIHLPFNLITTDVANQSTANFVQPFLMPDGKALVFANEFILVFYLDFHAPVSGDPSFNFATVPVTISTLSVPEWRDLHDQMVQMMAGMALKNLKRL